MKNKKAVLLINIGSPDSYKVSDVRKYLRQFLSDKRVINMPAFFRFLLVNGIIVPFRAPKSAEKYKEIWTETGSPLINHSVDLQKKLSTLVDYDVFIAMRYGNPSIEHVLNEIRIQHRTELLICPMYPQNASSTTSSSLEEVFRVINTWENYPSVKIISEFWNHPSYIKTFASHISKFKPATFDHIIFSFHGLPLSQVNKDHEGKSCEEMHCVDQLNDANRYCYHSVCYRTTELLVNELGLSTNDFSVSFQSRLTKNWLSPFTDDTLKSLAEQGKKNILIVCGSFVADCLETLHEIEIEYNEDFIKYGGKQLKLVPALNSENEWIKGLKEILED